jgi:hypothetical protein
MLACLRNPHESDVTAEPVALWRHSNVDWKTEWRYLWYGTVPSARCGEYLSQGTFSHLGSQLLASRHAASVSFSDQCTQNFWLAKWHLECFISDYFCFPRSYIPPVIQTQNSFVYLRRYIILRNDITLIWYDTIWYDIIWYDMIYLTATG